MPSTLRHALMAIFFTLFMICTAHAAETSTGFYFDSPDGAHKLALGARYHGEATSVTQRPLQQGDLSWMLAYEYHEEIAFWQIALGYAPKSQTDKEARVLTPEINLIFKDGIYRLGVGGLMSHVSAEKSEWTDLHWQAIMGISIPLGPRISVDLYGYYLFHKWDEIAKGSDNALEASLFLALQF